MEIRQYSSDGERMLTYTLQRVFPSAVGDVPVGWEQNNTLLRFPVTFKYYSWSTETISGTQQDDTQQPSP